MFFLFLFLLARVWPRGVEFGLDEVKLGSDGWDGWLVVWGDGWMDWLVGLAIILRGLAFGAGW